MAKIKIVKDYYEKLEAEKERNKNISEGVKVKRDENGTFDTESLRQAANQFQRQEIKKDSFPLVSRYAGYDSEEGKAKREYENRNKALGMQILRGITQNDKHRELFDKEFKETLMSIDAEKYASKVYNDDFSGQFGANFALGDAAIRGNKAAVDYMNNPENAASQERNEFYNQLRQRMTINNEEALDDEGAVLPVVSRNFASYLPQGIDQVKSGVKYGLPAAAAGGLVAGIPGAIKGAQAGYVAGSAESGYVQMAGEAFNTYLEMGLSFEDAKKLATNEGVINALIESGGALLDVATWGKSGVLKEYIKGGVKKLGVKGLAKIGISASGIEKVMSKAAVKPLVTGGKIIFDALGEGIEERTQQAVSLTNLRKAQSRQAHRMTDDSLRALAIDTLKNGFGGFTEEERRSISESGAEGFKLGLLLGGAHAGVSRLMNPRVKADRKNNPSVSSADRSRLSPRSAISDYHWQSSPFYTREPMGENGKKAFNSNFKEGDNFGVYAEGFERMYNLGLARVPFEKAENEIKNNDFISALSPDKRFAAYNAGLNDAEASLRAEKEAVKTVSYFSEDAGIAHKGNEDVLKGMDKKELKAIDNIAKALGSQVVFDETQDEHDINGYIDELGKIVINKNIEKGRKYVQIAAHEVTHRMQQLAPEEYRRYRDFVMGLSTKGVEGVLTMEQYRSFAERQEIYLTNEQIMDEIAADYTMKILTDAKKMNEFTERAKSGTLNENISVEENVSVLHKLYEAIHEFLEKIKNVFKGDKAAQDKAAIETFGTDTENLKQAEKLLLDAYKSGMETIENKRQEGSVQTGGSGKVKGTKKYSFVSTEPVSESDADDIINTLNKNINRIPTNIIFNTNEMPIKKNGETSNAIADYFDEIGGVAINPELGEVELNKRGAKSTTFHGIGKDKFVAVAAIKPVIENGIILEHKSNWKNRGYDTYLIAGKGVVGDENAVVGVVIKNYPKGNMRNKFYLHEVIKIGDGLNNSADNGLTRVTDTAVDVNAENVTKPTPTIDTITQKDNGVNSQYTQNGRKNSLKTGKLEKENELLRKFDAKMDEAVKNAKAKNADKRQLAKAARDILDEFGFFYDSEKLTSELEGLSEDTKQIISGKMTMETFKKKARDIAANIIEEGTRSDSEAYAETKKLRDYLRTTPISISESAKKNLGDEYNSLRKRLFGRVRLSNEGRDITEVYGELSELFPEFFSEEAETNASAQIKKIEEVVDGLKILRDNPYKGYEEEAADWLSNMIIERVYDSVFVSGEANKGKTTLTVDIGELRREMGDVLQRKLQLDREWKEREYNKLQKDFEKKKKNYSEKREKSIKLKQIKLHTERISKALLNPSERFMVPEDLKATVAEFLSCINLETDRIEDKTRAALLELRVIYEKVAARDDEYGMVVADPEIVENIKAVLDEIKAMDVKEKRISDLSLPTLEKLRQAIMAMEGSLRSYNKAFRQGKHETIDALSEAVREEINKIKPENNKIHKIGAFQSISDLLNFDMTNPLDFFHRFGKTFEGLGDELRNGFNKMVKNLNRAREYMAEIKEKYDIDEKEISGKKAEVYRFTVSNSSEVELTKSEIMSLFCLMRRPAALRHMAEGGIRRAKVEKKLIEEKDKNGKTVKRVELQVTEDYSTVRLTPEDAGKIVDTLTDSEKLFAAAVSKFFVKECAEWGNEVSLIRYGYAKYTDPNYFPVVSDGVHLPTEYGITPDARLEGKGFTKKLTPGANNPIILEDIFDVYARHTSEMANYNGFVVPISDIQRVINSKGIDGGEKLEAIIRAKYGKGAAEYLSDFMNELNIGASRDSSKTLTDGLVSKYKSAKVGANLRVVVQQPVSYLRAAALMDVKYLAAAQGHKVDVETVYKHAPIARWKDWGFFSLDTGKNMRELMSGKKKLSDYTMYLAGKADVATWKKLWAAVELETADLYPKISKGSAEFYEICGKRFDEIIDRTQVVDSTLHRSAIQRSKNSLTKMAVSFMSEPIKTYNLLKTAAWDCAVEKNAENKKKLARTVSTVVISSLALGVITAAWDTAVGDEDDEGFWEGLYNKATGKKVSGYESYLNSAKRRFIWNFTDNVISDYTGMIPYVKDVVSLVQGFNLKRMDMQGLSDLVAAGKILLSGNNYTWEYRLANFAAKAADCFGVPVSSLKKSVYDALVKNAFKAADSQWFDYVLLKQVRRVDSSGNRKQYLDILFDAYRKGHKDDYNEIMSDMIKSGINAKEIESGLKARYNAYRKTADFKSNKGFTVPWDNKSEIPSKPQEDKYDISKLTSAQYKKYSREHNALEKDIIKAVKGYEKEYSSEEYNKMLSSAYDYIEETALEKASGGKYETETKWINIAQEADEKYGLEAQDYIRYKTEYNFHPKSIDDVVEMIKSGVDIEKYLEFKKFAAAVKADRDQNDKAISGSKKKKVIEHLNTGDYTADEWNYLYYELMGYKR